jgi:hypothetical protein
MREQSFVSKFHIYSVSTDTSVTLLSVTRDEVWIDKWVYWTLTLVTTNNYDSLTEIHTPNITVTIAHIKSSQSSITVAW